MNWLGRRLIEVLSLLLLGAGAGLLLNMLRQDRLPYDLQGSLLLTESGARVVFLDHALRLFDEAEYIFVDARDRDAFVAGHIEGALSVPGGNLAGLYPELQLWSGGQPLLIYAGSGNHLPADDLAIQLRDAGERNILLLAEGYDGWLKRGYPVESGAEGLLDAEEDQGAGY